MFEKAGREVVDARERVAARVREELAAAGLPVAASGAYMGMLLGQGAEVTVDDGADATGGVVIRWRCHPVLRERALSAFPRLVEDPVFLHQAAVEQAMLVAITAVLCSAGFTVIDNPDDMDPMSLKVESAPQPGTPLTWQVPTAV